MKRFRLQIWSGTVLSPRTTPFCLQPIYACNIRFQSAATALQPDEESSIYPEQFSEAELRALPSRPPALASKSAKLSALHARLALSPRLPLETLARCLIDPSADPTPHFNNASLSLLGCDLLGYYTSESILCRYPRLPTAVVFAAMWAYVGKKTLAAITREWGVEVAAEPGGDVDPGYLQCKRKVAGNSDLDGTGILHKDLEGNRPNQAKGWRRGVSSKTMYDDYFGDEVSKTNANLNPHDIEREPRHETVSITVEDASSGFVRALMGAVYLHGGRKVAKTFFREHFLSRHLDVSKMFDFRQPTRDLSWLCRREGFEGPVARILSETGRLSRHPVFVVGVFSGKDKLGEGTGASLDEARIRAAVAALKGWYLYSPLNVRVPSDAEGDSGKEWKPVLIDGGEIVV